MIAYISGVILAKNLRDVTVLTQAGIGYRVFLPLGELHRIGNPNNPIALYTHTHVREDALELYGFLEAPSLKLFELLIQVSGVGPKLALAMLSGMETTHLQHALEAGDHKKLTQIPGIGPKMAQRIALELKGKIPPSMQIQASGTHQAFHDLRTAMLHLGYKQQSIEKAVQSIENKHKQTISPELSLSELIKEALLLLQQGN